MLPKTNLASLCALVFVSSFLSVLVIYQLNHRQARTYQAMQVLPQHDSQRAGTVPSRLLPHRSNVQSQEISAKKSALVITNDDALTVTEKVGSSTGTGLRCSKPLTNVYFLKVFKTGSTTLYNIFSRYAMRRQLRVVPYKQRPSEYIEDRWAIVNRIWNHQFAKGVQQPFNMLLDHSYFDLPAIQKALIPPVSFVTFLRNPRDMLRSWCFFFGKGHDKVNGEFHDSLIDYVTKPDMFASALFNPVSQLLRVNSTSYHSDFAKYIRDIDAMFFVGITEYYTHSLILLKRRSCWELKDVIFIQLRRQQYHKFLSLNKSSEATMDKAICAINKRDCYIYNYFNESFWRKVEAEGNNFRQEVTHFEMVLDKVANYCLSLIPVAKQSDKNFLLDTSQEPLHISGSEWSGKFDVTAEDCAIMTLSERVLRNYFFYAQNPEACRLLMTNNKRACTIQYNGVHLNCGELCKAAPDTHKMLAGLLRTKNIYKQKMQPYTMRDRRLALEKKLQIF